MRLFRHLALAALMCANPAFAITCFPGITNYRYVGDTASDAQCTDNDIQSAIDNAACPGTTIVVTREHLYTAQALRIDGKSLKLTAVGDGVACGSNPVFCDPNVGQCGGSPPPTQPLVTIDGGVSGKSVLTITGNSNVALQYLEFTGGSIGDSQRGGGIFFGDAGSGGYGSLTLDTVTVDKNQAGYGGGISFSPGGGSGTSTLTLQANTEVLNNTATHDGGGIRVEGNAEFAASAPETTVSFNHADNGIGGGIEIFGPAQADIGSPGTAITGVASNNSAMYGGGIAVVGNSSVSTGDATVRLFTTVAQQPVRISGNSASHSGGGIFVQPNTTTTPTGDQIAAATLCAYDFRIDGNSAQEGAAIYGDTDSYNLGLDSIGADVILSSRPATDTCDGASTAPAGAISCALGTPCDTMDDNLAIDANGNPTSGSTILAQNNGNLTVYGLSMQDNHAAHAIRALDNATMDIQDGLFAHNVYTSALMSLEGSNNSLYPNEIRGSTIADNTIGGSSIVVSSHDLEFYESILDQAALPAASMNSGATLYPRTLLAADVQGLPAYASIVQGLPSFVDEAQRNYHLLPTSLGIDFAAAGGGTDLDGRPRDVDLPSIPNRYGPRDLGAYERQSALACDDNADALFCDGFEGH